MSSLRSDELVTASLHTLCRVVRCARRALVWRRALRNEDARARTCLYSSVDNLTAMKSRTTTSVQQKASRLLGDVARSQTAPCDASQLWAHINRVIKPLFTARFPRSRTRPDPTFYGQCQQVRATAPHLPDQPSLYDDVIDVTRWWEWPAVTATVSISPIPCYSLVNILCVWSYVAICQSDHRQH